MSAQQSPTPSRKQQRDAARAARHEAERHSRERARRNRRLSMLGGVVVGAAIIVAIIVVVAGGGNGTPKKQAGEAVAGQTEIARQLRGIPQSGIVLGDPKAPVTMVEFGDLQCPVCKAYSQTVLPTIVDKYVRTGKVRLELRLISIIGPDSPKAAAMALAAGQQDKMWNYAEVFYVNQGQENSGYVTPDFLQRIGSGVPGLNVDQAMNARDGAKIQQQLADATRLAQINGINATPSFLLGPTGGTLRNFNVTRLDPKEFSQGIDAALKKA